MAALFDLAAPVRSLVLVFAAWKSVLLAFALGAVIGPDYDTSTSLFFDRLYGSGVGVPRLAASLTRWDALYFVQYAREGYVFEQQWAFGAAMPALVRLLTAAVAAVAPAWLVDTAAVAVEPLVAVALAHACHLVAVVALYRLTLLLAADARLAYVAAVLHVFSPAGVFLSAPYAESPFAALTFVGTLLFALALAPRRAPARRFACMVAAGAVLGLATAFRSNGLASGALFAVAAANGLVALAREPCAARAWALFAPGLGGLCVAAGSAVPQYYAWKRYCRDAVPELGPRPWCARAVPSVYSFVQQEYWDVGFLHYWRPSHVPLFLVAAPMLAILIKSGVDVARDPLQGLRRLKSGPGDDYRVLVRTLAATQAVIALLAITNYHVQIVNRMSSGYPVWYWWVASCLTDEKRQGRGRTMFVFMVMYAGVQSGLFSSFLPPA